MIRVVAIGWMAWACVSTAISSPAQDRTASAVGAPSGLDLYDVVWTSASHDASGSMPIGNGTVGANVWVEEDGDLVLLLSRTDAWSEACRLLKLGRIRVSLEPNPFAKGKPFRQRLRLRDGRIDIDADDVHLSVLVDPESPSLRVLGSSTTPRAVHAQIESWRNGIKDLRGEESNSAWTMREAPKSVPVLEGADVHVVDSKRTSATWYHWNKSSIVPLTLQHQGLGSARGTVRDPLLSRVIGGSLWAEGFALEGEEAIATRQPRTSFDLRIATHVAQVPNADSNAGWLSDLHAIEEKLPARTEVLRRTSAWWSAFFGRSWIFVEGDRAPSSVKSSHPLRVGADSNGANVFHGDLARASVYARQMMPAEIAALAKGPPDVAQKRDDALVTSFRPGRTRLVDVPAALDGSTARVFGDIGSMEADGKSFWRFEEGHLERTPGVSIADLKGLTLEAWIRIGDTTRPARILDQITAGASDGFLFDTHPGDALRIIIGDITLTKAHALRANTWHHVAATWEASTHRTSLFVDGAEVASSPAREESATPSMVTRAYVLQRWIQACGGRGPYPIKFNGSIFTVDAKHTGGPDFDPDWRKWGDGYWWQNTRLSYYPMLASGDFEMMEPLFALYRDALPLCAARARLYHGVSGAYFPETMSIFGTYSNNDYGWDRTGLAPNDVQCPWWMYAWNQGLELVVLMLDRYDYTQDVAFLRREVLPMARSVLDYFDARFARDAQGKLVVSPTQALETHWHGVVNDAPVVGGLHAVVGRLRALPEPLMSTADRALWDRLNAALPALPVAVVDGLRVLSPAERFDPSRQNCETPELWSVFPFRVAGLGADFLPEARAAFERRHDKFTNGWPQDGQFAALLGLADQAASNLIAKAQNSNPRHRFPAMWGPNFDWLPDQCHGANILTTLQLMLMQCEGDRIRVLPAWPKGWNASFRLHAPKNTTLEGVVRDGKLESLRVEPESRRKDVVVGG